VFLYVHLRILLGIILLIHNEHKLDHFFQIIFFSSHVFIFLKIVSVPNIYRPHTLPVREHREATSLRHAGRSTAAHSTSCHDSPNDLISESYVRYAVRGGLPRRRNPLGRKYSALFGQLSLGIFNTWPSHIHLPSNITVVISHC
jgi:hypothetical protein